MTVHTICDRCGMEYDHVGVQVGGQIFCCQGCASGTGCTCAVAAPAGTVVVEEPAVVVQEPAVVERRVLR